LNQRKSASKREFRSRARRRIFPFSQPIFTRGGIYKIFVNFGGHKSRNSKFALELLKMAIYKSWGAIYRKILPKNPERAGFSTPSFPNSVSGLRLRCKRFFDKNFHFLFVFVCFYLVLSILVFNSPNLVPSRSSACAVLPIAHTRLRILFFSE
jgi:hypothetical protein